MEQIIEQYGGALVELVMGLSCTGAVMAVLYLLSHMLL